MEGRAPSCEEGPRGVPPVDPPGTAGGTPLADHGGLWGSQVDWLGDQVGEEGSGGQALGGIDSPLAPFDCWQASA